MERREILRYLGYGREEADEAVNQLIDECQRELEKAASPKHIYREFPLKLLPDGRIDGGGFQTVSRNLWRNLRDCEQIILFAATLGSGVDVLIGRYSRLQMSKAIIMQAAGAAMIEEYCDQVNEQMKAEYESRGLYLRPRFSPGYGDFSLECQTEVTGALETGKRIGITLTDSLLMAPSKSVTAVIGVSKVERACTVKGCELCGKIDCAYKRG